MKSLGVILAQCFVVVYPRPYWEVGRVMVTNDSSNNTSQCPSWIGYDYKATYDSGACLPCSFFDTSCFQTPIDSVPYPHSVYDFSQIDTNISSGGVAASSQLNTSGVPHISVSTWSSKVDTGVNVFTPLSPEWTYNWPDFQANKNDLVWQLIEGKHLGPGVFKVKVNAWDYSSESGVCELCFSISDAFHPESLQRCPSERHQHHQELREWSSTNINQLVDYLSVVDTFVQSRHNNDCSDAGSSSCVDITKVSGSDWFECPLVDDATSLASLYENNSFSKCVQIRLAANPFTNDQVLNNPAIYLKSSQCAREISFNFTWFERTVDYSCDAPPRATCASGLGLVETPDYSPDKYTCANVVGLAATGIDLVKQISVKSNDKSLFKNGQDINNRNFNLSDTPHNSSTHLWINEDSNGVPLPGIYPIQDLILTSAITSELGQLLSSSFVFWRWKLDESNSEWQDYAANTNVILQNPINVLRLEAWTQCGPVQENIVWTIYQHIRPSVHGWFHANWLYADDIDHCNIESSDFSAVYFKLDKDLRVGWPNGYTLNSMNCKWSYDTPYTASTSAWNLDMMGSQETYFAISLLTAQTTKVAVECSIEFHDGKSIQNEAHSHPFWLKNCEKPTLNNPIYKDESCVEACYEDARLEYDDKRPAPFQACGGNLVYPSTDSDGVVGTILHLGATYSCCATCNRYGFSHQKVVSCLSSPVGDISRCEPIALPDGSPNTQPTNPTPLTQAASSFILVTPTSIPLSLVVTLTFIGCLLVVLKLKSRQSGQLIESDDLYVPLFLTREDE